MKKLGILQNKIQILSTRPIDPSQINTAKDFGINIDCISFIETKAIEDSLVSKTIKSLLDVEATIVFTSMNAVESVAAHLNKNLPEWKIYCIGITTNKLVKKYFGENSIIGTAINAQELAGLIVDERKTNKLYFFCGDQRRDELPSILKKNGIRLHEIEVYRTIEVPFTINKIYQGILFYSPSAVNSFFNSNHADEHTIFFAIGNTTAKALADKTKNKIVISEMPGKDKLVQLMIDYFIHSK